MNASENVINILENTLRVEGLGTNIPRSLGLLRGISNLLRPLGYFMRAPLSYRLITMRVVHKSYSFYQIRP